MSKTLLLYCSQHTRITPLPTEAVPQASPSQPLLSSPLRAHHLPALQAALECVSLMNIILVGDFNVGLFDPTLSPLSDLNAATSFFHLSQIVTEPTRLTDTTATLFDLVYVSDPSSIAGCTTIPPLLNSDHLCITVDLKYRSPHLSSLPHRVLKYNAADLEGANDFLSTALPDHIADDVNLSWNTFQSIFLTSMSTYIPSQVVAVRCSFPWLTRELKTLFHKRDSALRQAKKYSKPTHWEVYNRLRNKAAAALRFAKSISTSGTQ